MAFVVGLILGGVLASAGLWVAGRAILSWVRPWLAFAVIVAVAILSVLSQFRIVKVGMPENRRQVPETVFDKGRVLGGLHFGLEMGTGMRTFVPSLAPYVLAAGVLFGTASFAEVLGLGVGFALGRAVVPLGWVAVGSIWQHKFNSHANAIRVWSVVAVASTALFAFLP